MNTELRTYRDYKGIGMCIVGKIEELRNDIGSLGCKVTPILDPPPPYYVFVALCIVVIVVSLIKIAASNENIECFREYFAVGYRAPDLSFF